SSGLHLVTLFLCASRQRLGRTHPSINFRKTAPISSQRAPTSKLTIFAPRFCSAVFSLSRATSAGNLKPGLCFQIIITLLLIPKTIQETRAVYRKCWAYFTLRELAGSIDWTRVRGARCGITFGIRGLPIRNRILHG